MQTRQKLFLLLGLLLGLNLVSTALLVRHLGRSRTLNRALQETSKVPVHVLIQARQVSDLVAARDRNDRLGEAENALLLRTGLAQVDTVLGRVRDMAPVTSAPALRESYAYFDDLWVLYRDAVDAVLSGHFSTRNHGFVLSHSLELVNRMTEVVKALETERALSWAAMRRLMWGSLAGFVVVMAVSAWVLYSDLLRPLYAITDRMRQMSNGKLPLEAQLPFEGRDEFSDLSRYFNVFMDHLRTADRTKDRFLATMSHEIRTPMNGVIGFLDNLAETDLSEQQRQYVRVIDSSARALLRVINEILDFSKLAAGKMDLEFVAFDLGSLLRERTALAQQLARSKDLKVRSETAGTENLIIRGDPTRLRQVLDNLLSNAVKFTQTGEVCLAAQSQPVDTDRVRIRFSVTDTGPGIPPAEQEHLFEAFSQAQSHTARKYGGTGLGLCIASNLVSLMGGRLGVESLPTQGSRFSFEIETSTAPPEEQVQLSEHYVIRLPPGALKKYWALLVDDTPTNLFLMETICQGIGLPYLTAVNGKEAVQKAKQQTFDLIFMDIQMPVMDGYTAIREIRRLENAATTQIIALTASAMQEDVEKALGVGSTGFMAKPFERSQLLLCIAEHLGVPVERELREMPETRETHQELAVRQMYDFMREQYQISLGEIKLILAQSVADWRPQLDDILVFAKKGNWSAVRPIMHRLKGQLGAIGLPRFAELADDANRRIKEGAVETLPRDLDEFVSELGAIFRAAEREITLTQA